jgi:hypothetical protein
MMITPAFLAVAATASWYGPASVTFNTPVSGNPFSPVENDARVTFSRGGKKLERFAYYSQGKWHAVLTADAKGEYAAELTVNGKSVEKQVVKLSMPLKDGYIRVLGNRFRFDSGAPYIPHGHNFGWEAGVPYPKQLADMAKAGLNWSRIWACGWDGKNPYIPRESTEKLTIGSMYEPALERWQMVTDNCEKTGIKFQFVLFHHGMYSSTTDSNWKDHPWNKANGGFLARPNDFFTDPKAKELSKNWLRYAVARYAHSPSVMAWELFNEVQWVDEARRPGGWAVVAAWHKEMADYLRSIDPYHHPITTSSELDPALYAAVDYEQPHTYPPSVFGAIVGTKPLPDRPLFFGEFGGSGPAGDAGAEQAIVRDGFWAGLLAGQSGPGQYWYWDRAYSAQLYDEYARQTQILAKSGFAEHPQGKPLAIAVTGTDPTDLTVRPGRGWAKTDKFVFQLPSDAATGAFPELSGYIQGAKGGNRTMMAEPIRIRFTAPRAGVATIKVGEISQRGGGISLMLNGNPIIEKSWPSSPANHRANETFSVPFLAGANEITLDNPGEDWVNLDSISIPGAGAGVSATAWGTSSYALARLQWHSPATSATTVQVSGLTDGMYELRQFNLATGRLKTSRTRVQGGKLGSYTPAGNDEGIVLLRK